MEESEYKEINYRGTLVQVSKQGQVRWNGTQRNIYLNQDGYSVCAICIPGGGWRGVSVARLVALAYIPNPDNLPEVNHKDYNRANACVDNLEWITHADNVRYSNCNRPDYRGEKNPNYGNRKLSQIYAADPQYAKEKQGRPGIRNGRCVKIQLFKDGELIKTFDYIGLCCEYLRNVVKVTNASVDSIRERISQSIKNNKAYKGYTFKKIT